MDPNPEPVKEASGRCHLQEENNSYMDDYRTGTPVSVESAFLLNGWMPSDELRNAIRDLKPFGVRSLDVRDLLQQMSIRLSWRFLTTLTYSDGPRPSGGPEIRYIGDLRQEMWRFLRESWRSWSQCHSPLDSITTEEPRCMSPRTIQSTGLFLKSNSPYYSAT